MCVCVPLILQKKLPDHHKMNFSLLKYVAPEDRGGKESKDKKARCVTGSITDLWHCMSFAVHNDYGDV